MPIEPFKIINDDGSTNQAEYDRCINFINDYIAGNIKVYPDVTWANPLEVDLSTDESAFEILNRLLSQTSNKLLNARAFNNIKKLFTGLLERYGSTIHTCGKYLEQSKNFIDGPGYMYDVFSSKETEVKSRVLTNNITIYYLDDDNHTVLEYNDTNYSKTNVDYLPTINFPKDVTDNNLVSNVARYPNIYKGNLCGVYSDFQRLSGQYVGSSTLYYFSECNDELYTTGASSYRDDRVNEVINFNYRAKVSNKLKPARGVDLSLVGQAQSSVVNPADVNAYISPATVNPSVTYVSPTTLTASEPTEWII